MCDTCGGGGQSYNNDDGCSPCGNFDCSWDFIKSFGPPENLPDWFKCPAEINEKIYPVPQGAVILKISEGGRNGSSKKKFNCAGTCTQPAKEKPADAKPNIGPECPMSKTTMQGLGCCEEKKVEEKPPSLMDKIKSLFGGGKKKDEGKAK